MPLTRAEASSYQATSTHADVMAFIAALDDPRLHVSSFGVSPGGRELPLLVASAHRLRTPAEARARSLPVVLLLCGIHAGEVEGKEGCLALVRDLLGRDDELLSKTTLLVVPLFNPDGNDAMNAENRKLDLAKLKGQLGPALVGTRVNGSGINLNRDYLRMQAPEMRLLQSNVIQPWQPDLVADNHATNGSVHRFAMTVDVPHTIASGRPEPIEYMRARLVPDVIARVRAHGFESGWYGNFVEDERALDRAAEADPASAVGEGWMTYPHHPRFGSNYRGLTNRLDILLECYSYLSFEERVKTAYAWNLEILRHVAQQPDAILELVASSRTPRDRIAIRSKLERFDDPIEILTRTPRTLEGAPASVRIPYFGRFVGTTIVDRPFAYLVPDELAAHLRAHGLSVESAPSKVDAEIATLEALGTEGGRAILEAKEVGEARVSWKREGRACPPGTKLVRTDQPLGAIAVYLCEPESDDGAYENDLAKMPPVGAELPIWRVHGR
jgi:hypothetical protein